MLAQLVSTRFEPIRERRYGSVCCSSIAQRQCSSATFSSMIRIAGCEQHRSECNALDNFQNWTTYLTRRDSSPKQAKVQRIYSRSPVPRLVKPDLDPMWKRHSRSLLKAKAYGFLPVRRLESYHLALAIGVLLKSTFYTDNSSTAGSFRMAILPTVQYGTNQGWTGERG